MSASKQTLDELALTEAEYEAIVDRLGREPNRLELGLFGSLWSEHCGYKHSKPLLRLLPSDSPRLLVSPGTENAGAVDIGGGLAVVMKIESHNHPTAIEPHQGAATGVGGIVRDIFAMGARPIALMNSLRFGDPDDARSRYLFEGAVAGISAYGNCIGVPNVGGEAVFSRSYAGNPLVNAMCVGLLPAGDLARATTGGAGNLLMLVGSDTGRDGIHGASGLASRSFEEERELRPTVQVGNPFMEKVLIEACLEAAKTEHVVGMQDLGAAGLASASIEMASNGAGGVEIDVALVPRRETEMNAYEVMLSESQERMLIAVKPGGEAAVKAIFDKWDLQSAVIGRAADDGLARILDGGVPQGEAPIRALADAPEYRIPPAKPDWLPKLQGYDMASIPLPTLTPEEALLRLLASPNIAAKEWIYRQYDYQVQTNTIAGPGGDAAVLRVKGVGKGIALSTDGNGRLCHLDPFVGGQIAVAEACRNVSCVGAEPIALTDCLNFGNPERPEVYYQLEECVKGMAAASEALGAPVISGNVSLYNETQGESIYPTPIIGCLGLLDDAEKSVGMAFAQPGDFVVVIGADPAKGDPAALAGSECLQTLQGLAVGMPAIDLNAEAALQRALRRIIRAGFVRSAHDCSDGGLAVALAECAVAGGLGVECPADQFGPEWGSLGWRWDAALFGETQSRVVASMDPQYYAAAYVFCSEEGVPFKHIGAVTEQPNFAVGGLIHLPLSDLADAWNGGLERALRSKPD